MLQNELQFHKILSDGIRQGGMGIRRLRLGIHADDLGKWSIIAPIMILNTVPQYIEHGVVNLQTEKDRPPAMNTGSTGKETRGEAFKGSMDIPIRLLNYINGAP